MPPPLPEEVRRHCAQIAHHARWVRIDAAASTRAAGVAGLDADQHFLEGDDEAVARYVLILDAVNFGSGWFPTLRDGTTVGMTRRLTAHARRRGAPWTAAELRALDAAQVAAVLEEDPAHPLMEHYAEGLRQLGRLLGDGGALDLVGQARGSAAALARRLARDLPYFADHGFYKRAQITANDLALAGVATFADLDDLTVFADNFLPHVLRLDGVLVLDADLAARIDAGVLLAPGSPRRSSCAPAPSTPASSWPPASASRRASWTTGCGTAAWSPPTPGAPRTSAARSSTDGDMKGSDLFLWALAWRTTHVRRA